MSNSITAKTSGSAVSAQVSQTRSVASPRILPVFPQYNSPLDVTLTIPSFVVHSVEQAVSPALAAQSYQTNPVKVESNNSEVSELGPRSGKF
ncbi:MAG: hypothetical protein ACRCYP_04805 [Alphaproteobacteria bacterium]